MDNWNMIAAAVNIGAGLCFILICIPLLKDKVPMNNFYGMRFAQAFKSNENWYVINRHGARQLIVRSVPLILVGVASLFVPFGDRGELKGLFLFAPAIAAISAFIANYRYARTL
jgi:hypothetical protein